MHVSPVLLDCNFVVDSTNGDGLGIRSLKGPAIANVFMKTSATPAAGNPNPGSGTIIVQLADSYNRYFGGFAGSAAPVGTPATSTTAGVVSIVTSLGTATSAQWLAAGFPAAYLSTTTGLPSVGAAFIPTVSATIGGSATAAPIVSTGSGIDHIELVGDPNMTLSSQIQGGQLVFQCFLSNAQAAPANGTVISMSFYLSNSSILIQGE